MDPEIGTQIKFVKLEHGKIKRESISPSYDPRPSSLQRTTSQEISDFMMDLNTLKNPCSFLHVLPSMTLPSVSISTTLPPTPRSSREKVLVEMKTTEHPISFSQIVELGKKFIARITPSPACQSRIEAATRSQSQSKRWHEEHFGRLTASKFGEVIKCRTPSMKCFNLLYPSKSVLSSASLQWGKDNEEKARNQYQLHSKYSVRESGIHISDLGFLAASPDGLVYDADDQLVGIIEIKCPYSVRNSTVWDACSRKSFFCTKIASTYTETIITTIKYRGS